MDTGHHDKHHPTGPPLHSATHGTAAWADWQSIRHELEKPAPTCGLNMAHAAVTRHAIGVDRDRPALRWLAVDGCRKQWTFAQLERLTNRVANGLKSLDVAPGEVVATLCGRVPELYLTALGTLKAGAVFSALFATYGPEPILHRLAASQARVLVTTRQQYAKIQSCRTRLPALKHVLLIDAPDHHKPGVAHLQALLDTAADTFVVAPTDPEAPALIHFTSGTTGMPKGVVHVHAAALHHLLTARSVLDLKPGEIYWCTADPGWVTGVVYGFLAPLMAGAMIIIDEADFDARRWLGILADERVSVWYTSPSALRRLMSLPVKPCQSADLKALRLVFSVGEPLHASAVHWGEEALGVPIRDTWWQSETGGIMIANTAHAPVRPGAMGRPVTGIRAAVVRPAANGTVAACGTGEVGELALAAGWPSMFRRMLGKVGGYERYFSGGWYLTGDLARVDADGTFWFVGRADDMIKSSGHMVSPFEVESVLMESPGVADAGVVGVPDDHLGQRVRAYITLAPGIPVDEALRYRILAFARQRLGPALAPREIVFIRSMPKNPAGKTLRRELTGHGGPERPASPGN